MPDCIGVEQNLVEEGEKRYRNIVYSYSPIDFVRLSDLFREETGLLGALRVALEVHESMSHFQGEKLLSGAQGVPNVFADGFDIATDGYKPLVPASALAPKLLVSRDEITVRCHDNRLDSAWDLLLRRVEASSKSFLPYSHLAQIKAEELREYLFPEDAGDTESQISFLRILLDFIPEKEQLTAHEIEHRKLISTLPFHNGFSIITENHRVNDIPHCSASRYGTTCPYTGGK